MRFEWDTAKDEANRRKHGIAFEDAARVFLDPLRLDRFDRDHSFDEERWITIGFVEPSILLVVYTQKHEDTCRLISARKANAREKKEYCGL